MSDWSANAVLTSVQGMCVELGARSPEVAWDHLEETDLMAELAACILGSQVSFEMGAAAARRLRDRELLSFPYALPSPSSWETQVYIALCEPLQDPAWPTVGRRYRFPRSRAQYLRETFGSLAEESVTLTNLLGDSESPRDARKRVVSFASGNSQ
jgi:3-methyladenine DNA glycosylase/8-oxoguanine DNA glycosylase